MATTKSKHDSEILGYWRKVESGRPGEVIELHLRHSLEAYDRVLLNGRQIYPAIEQEKVVSKVG